MICKSYCQNSNSAVIEGLYRISFYFQFIIIVSSIVQIIVSYTYSTDLGWSYTKEYICCLTVNLFSSYKIWLSASLFWSGHLTMQVVSFCSKLEITIWDSRIYQQDIDSGRTEMSICWKRIYGSNTFNT